MDSHNSLHIHQQFTSYQQHSFAKDTIHFTFVWIPDHANLSGHELVDVASKEGALIFSVPNIPSILRDLKTLLEIAIKQMWQKQ